MALESEVSWGFHKLKADMWLVQISFVGNWTVLQRKARMQQASVLTAMASDLTSTGSGGKRG